MKYHCKTVSDTEELGYKIGKIAQGGTILALEGSLGAGKTVLAKGIARALEIKEAVVSPTFTLVQEYEGSLPMRHLDLYRISGSEEFQMMGGEEMLYSDGLVLIEWPEKISDMLPEDTVFVKIQINPDLSRDIEISGLKL